jgi:hypothetical protein
MPSSADAALGLPVEEFRQLLLRCRKLYASCARDYAEKHPELIQDSPESFIDRMVDLHRGLVLKVFAEMALADNRISGNEMVLARELFQHAWGRQLDDQQLREALQHYLETTHLRWDSLLWPFERLSAFRPHAAEIQEVVEELAALVGRAGGRMDSRGRRELRWIRSQVAQAVERISLAPTEETPPTESPTRVAVLTRKDNFEATPQGAEHEARAGRITPRRNDEQLADVLDELDGLIGLDTIKAEVRELVNFLKIQAERARHGLPETPVTLHAVYTGNPGTGKTTIARLFGRILGAMGILKRGHLVETDRSGLVAEYAGQTAPKTNKRIDEALDGVLFIDEAYSLVAETGDDPYGAEALQGLLKRMEDDRQRLVVILAGYPGPMQVLLHKNPGLSSRFSRSFAFPDYTAVELGRIFETMCQRDHYELPARVRAKLLLGFQHLLDRRDEHFGNGRLARNIFERAVRRLANRLAPLPSLTRELLTRLEPEDIVMEGVPAAVWSELERDGLVFRLSCPSCRHTSRLAHAHLGCKVQCRRCNHEFVADWGEVINEAGAV